MSTNIMRHHRQGVGLLEVVIGSAIILTGILSLVAAYNVYLRYALDNERNVQAAFLLEEGIESVKLIRDGGWSNYITPLAAGTMYYFHFDGSLWSATTTAGQHVDGVFLRTFTIENVYRDGDGDIVTAGGSLDSDTKKVTVTIAFRIRSGTTTRSISTYITNMHN
jgi:hypothetical protein